MAECLEIPETVEKERIMRIGTLRFAIAALLLPLLAACQSVGPSGDVAGRLAAQGFVAAPGAVSLMNARNASDDIQTVAVYLCNPPACAATTLVGYGRDPNGEASFNDLSALSGVSAARRQRLFAKYVGEGSEGSITPGPVSTFERPGGIRGLTFTGTMRGRGFIRMTMIISPASSRVVAAISADRALAQRFGGPEMLD
jgi:hypothetical protein